MDNIRHALCRLLEDAAEFEKKFRFIVNHSSNPMEGRRGGAPLDKTMFFDWLEEFAKDFSAPIIRVCLEGDLLWLSGKIFFNLKSFPEDYDALAVLDAREKDQKRVGNRTYKILHGSEENIASIAKLITELNFPGAFMRHLAYEVDIKKSFSSNRDMLRQFLSHLHVKGTRLPVIEEIYESMFFSWNMVVEKEGVCAKEPWNQTWRELPGRFAQVQKQLTEVTEVLPTYRGQRNLVFDMFCSGDVSTSVEKLISVFFSAEEREKTALTFKTSSATAPRNGTSLGFWIAGNGMPRDALRRWVLRNTPNWNTKKVDPWASHLLLWIDPTHFSVENKYFPVKKKKDDARVKRLKAFCAAAFLTKNFPEAHDCQMSTWTDLVKRSAYHDEFLKMKPHLSHVVEKIRRLRKKITPSDYLCRSILECADEYVEEKQNKMQKHSRKDIETSKDVDPYTIAEVANRLKKEGCVTELAALQRVHEDEVAECYEEGERVTHIDILHSASLIPGITVVRTSRQIFAVGKEDLLKNMVLYKHPLSELRMESKTQHPLWSPKQDLLAIALK